MSARVGIPMGFVLLALALAATVSATALGHSDWVGPLFIASAVFAVLAAFVGVRYWNEMLAKAIVAFSVGVLVYFFTVLLSHGEHSPPPPRPPLHRQPAS